MTPAWPHRAAPGIGGRGHRPAGSGRTAFVTPEAAWRNLIAACRAGASGARLGPGLFTEVGEARKACAGAPFPVAGEPAKSAAIALLEMTRTWSRCGEDERGWHGDSVLALAKQCEVLLDQMAAARARRISGERD